MGAGGRITAVSRAGSTSGASFRSIPAYPYWASKPPTYQKMSRTLYNVVEPPTGETYRQLVAFLFRYSASCSLVLRKQIPTTPSQQVFLDRAQQFLVKKSEQKEWPGTLLLGGVADVFVYQLTRDLEFLILQANGLYDWQSPNLPEDIAFYRSDNSLLLGSIAHESDSFLELTEKEREDLYQIVPAIKIAL